MTDGMTIFMVGTIALTNAGLLYYLLSERNSKLKTPQDSNKDDLTKTDEAPKEESEKPKSKSRVGASKTVIEDIDTYIKKMVKAQIKDEFVQLRESLLGDVDTSDVEFKDAPEGGQESQPESSVQENDTFVPHARMTKEQEEASFEDVRINDVDEDMVSAPSATGASMDEVEEALATADNPDATPEEKAKAGDIFDKLMDTYLMDKITSDEEILKKVNACVLESVRLNFTKESPRKVESVVKNRTTIIFPKDVDQFNVEDIFNL